VSALPEPPIEELVDDAPSPSAKPKPAKTTIAKPATKTKPSTTATTATTSADCTPPYTWDSLGRRIYKRHCLNQPP
jgi:hypothetical protein